MERQRRFYSSKKNPMVEELKTETNNIIFLNVKLYTITTQDHKTQVS